MQAVILAAGRGSRLRGVTKGVPKCLLPVGSTTIIEYQLALLRRLGIEEIAIVTGYRADEVRRALGEAYHYILNPRFRTTDTLYSLWLAHDWVRGDVLLCNGDVVAHPQIYQRLLASSGNALTYDTRLREEADMKVKSAEGRVQAVGKGLPPQAIDGESLGLLKVSAVSLPSLFEQVKKLLDEGGEKQFWPAAISRLVERDRVAALDVAGLPWTEIDDPEHLVRLKTCVWPAIQRATVRA